MHVIRAVTLAAALGWVVPASAATPREMLTQAAFQTRDKAAALALVNQALAATEQQLAANAGDKEAQIQHGVAIGDRARLAHSAGDAKEARREFERFAAANPHDPEGQLAIATWHLDSVDAGFLTATVLGAKKDIGMAALDRAVAWGGGRPFFTGFAALLRIRGNPGDVAAATRLATQAASAPATTPLDRIAQRQAKAVLIPLQNGDGKAAAQLARKLLPFGRI
jgi:hypothetical protein